MGLDAKPLRLRVETFENGPATPATRLERAIPAVRFLPPSRYACAADKRAAAPVIWVTSSALSLTTFVDVRLT